MPLPQKKLIPGLLLALGVAALAAPPLWWSTGNPPVIDLTAQENNQGPANIGQAKHIVSQALIAIDTTAPTIATEIRADLTAILDLTVPDPKTSAWIDKQNALLLVGQLKAIADPFYNHLHAAHPAWLEAERTANGTNHPNSIFPWTAETTDDANKAIANIGQLKAVFSLRFDTLPNANTDTDGDGMPDEWETDNGFDPNDPNDAAADPDGDGLTNEQENALGTDPNSFDQIGPVNFDFDEEIVEFPELSFRPEDPEAIPYEHPSDLYHQDSVEGWKAAIGEHIEIWDEGDGNTYAELQSHWDAKGIEQEFDMLPGTTLTFILRYKGRYDAYIDSNPFKLKVEGAHEVLVNGEPAQTQGTVKEESFMDDDEWEKYTEWQYAVITITADPQATTLVPITLTLIPDDTDESMTYGGFVDFVPVDITVVFGEGPGNGANESVHTTAKENLENFLETVEVAKVENIWIVEGKDDRHYGIEIATDEATLLRSLATSGQTVIYDGHANFGLGPNFTKATHKTIGSFTNFGTGATDIPVKHRGDGTETDVMPYINGQIPFPPPPALQPLVEIQTLVDEEGWAYLVADGNEVKGDIVNDPIPHMLGRWKYESEHGVSAGSPLQKQGTGLMEYHFITASQSKRIIVSAPGDDLPDLRYKTFFYNACSSGPHFIKNFDHGEFIYTNRLCAVFRATEIFVRGIIEEKTTEEILENIEIAGADGEGNEQVITYEVKNF